MAAKRIKAGKWTRYSDKPAQRLDLGSTATYANLVDFLKKELGVTGECCLLNMTDEEIPEENFSVVNYVKTNKKYVATTRHYLGVKPSSTTIGKLVFSSRLLLLPT